MSDRYYKRSPKDWSFIYGKVINNKGFIYSKTKKAWMEDVSDFLYFKCDWTEITKEELFLELL